MTESSSAADHRPTFNLADEEATAYRGLSVLALLGLLTGLASPLAIFGTVWWLVPLTAMALSALGLRQIAAQSPNLIGRKAALVGMFLGTTFLVAAPVDDAVYRYYIRREAREFAQQWIEAVRHGEVYKAHILMIDPKRRAPPDMSLADFYRGSDSYRSLLKLFTKEPTIRTLFALGTDAEYRYYETANEGSQESGDYVQMTYAVTYKDSQGQPTTFFISLLMARIVQRASGRCDWTISHVDGGVRPPGW